MGIVITKDVVEDNWPLTDVTIEVMPTQGNGGVVGIVRAEEGSFTYKIPGPWKTAITLERDLEVYGFLIENGFTHVPQLLKTRENKKFVSVEDKLVFLYKYVEGDAPLPTPETYKELAKILAELHSIKDFPFESDYKPAEAILELIQGADKFEFKDEYITILKSIPSFTHLPLVPIHTELTPQNCIVTKSGNIVALDWDEAGLGHAVMDLGVGLINHFITEDLEFKNENATSYYQTYFTLHPMPEVEKEYIYHAGLFWACAWVGYGDTPKRWERIKWAIANKAEVTSLYN
jgi:Ser/Thr protein kinase RdoA (MazF antagonist)